MNLLKLLSATHSIGTVREKPAAYVSEALPSFGWERAPGKGSGPQVARRARAFWRVLWPFGGKGDGVGAAVSVAAANPIRGAAAGSGAGPRWGRRRPGVDPVQRELAFESLKPVRNDLRDEDYEVTTVSRPANRSRRPGAVPEAQPQLSWEQST